MAQVSSAGSRFRRALRRRRRLERRRHIRRVPLHHCRPLRFRHRTPQRRRRTRRRLHHHRRRENPAPPRALLTTSIAGAKSPHPRSAASPLPTAGTKIPLPSCAAPPPPHAGAKSPHPSGRHVPGTPAALQAVTLNPSSILDGLDGSSAATAQTLPDLVYPTMKAEDLLPPYLPNGHQVYTHWTVTPPRSNH
jgi:hypothetical protein